MTPNKSTLLRTVLLSWLLVGTLDLAAAILQTLIMGGNPVILLKFIASGVFGQAAFSGGMGYAIAGGLFHYCIAFIWTAFFFLVYLKVKEILRNNLLIGVLYGLFIWGVMNLIVLPLAHTPERSLEVTGSIIAMGILICAIGLPLTFSAHTFYRKK